MKRSALVMVCFLFLFSGSCISKQQPATDTQPTGSPPGTMMLTVFLRHDESKTLDEINAHLKKTGFDKNFPPHGVEIVSWYVMMGIGQVVTLRFPAERLRDVNLAVEHGAWGGYRTEFYATYDLRAEKLIHQSQ